MRQRVGFAVVLVLVGLVLAFGRAIADDDPPAQPAESEHHEAATPPAEAEHHEGDAEHHEQPAEAEHHEQPAEGEHHEGDAEHHDQPAEGEHHDEHAADAEHHEDHDAEAEHHEEHAADSDSDEEDVPYNKFDIDGDGTADPAVEKEYTETFVGVSEDIDSDKVDAELEARPEDSELKPSISIEDFRKAVRLVKKIVLAKMQKKMAKKSAQKMQQFSTGIFVMSLAGLLLLLTPLFLRKKYPGKTGMMFKYSALASLTFFLTVNLFGGVLMGMKTVQGQLGDMTNPTLAIAGGTFDTLDQNAERYITMGRELFMPTLRALEGNSDEQPAVLILQNGQKVIKKAQVFVAMAKTFKSVSWVFGYISIILFLLTMVLFAKAIKPTLTEIIKLPARAAAGHAGVGRDVTKQAMRRIWGEMLASICTIGVLVGITLLSAFVLGQVIVPAIDTLLTYFSLAVQYLQFMEDASSGVVFLTLFAVILFLVFNLATLILSTGFFLGKTQKIFQQRFNEGVPVSTHKRFFKWGIPAVVFVQLFPLLFVLVANKCVDKINDSLVSGVLDADKVPWGKLLLAGPAFLVGGYALMFWGVRGFKAIGFLFKYKVVPVRAPEPTPSSPAEAI
jgi:hypothetical protein